MTFRISQTDLAVMEVGVLLLHHQSMIKMTEMETKGIQHQVIPLNKKI